MTAKTIELKNRIEQEQAKLEVRIARGAPISKLRPIAVRIGKLEEKLPKSFLFQALVNLAK